MNKILQTILDELEYPSVDIHYNNIYVAIWVRHHSKGTLFTCTANSEDEVLSKTLKWVKNKK